VTLDTYADPSRLYAARGDEVNPNRPLFTGDIFAEIPVPGMDDAEMVLILAHPCSFRAGIALTPRVLVASVRTVPKQGAGAWTKGFFNRMPLPELAGDDFWAAHLDDVGQAATVDLHTSTRIACLSEIGINMLQQRLTFHLTRAEIPTDLFNQAFAHTLEEADLLEEWIDTLAENGWSNAEATSRFDDFIRSGAPTLQVELLQPQARSHVRMQCRREAERIVREEPH